MQPNAAPPPTSSAPGLSAPLAGRVALLRSRLAAFRQRLAHSPADPAAPEFLTAMQEFLDFIRVYDDPDAYAAFERTAELAEFRASFAPCVLRFTWAMENHTFAELMAKKTPGLTKMGPLLGAHTWGSYARMEETLKLVDFSACRTYLMLGCGRVPGSLFYLHDWTAVDRLVGIDTDPDALRMARELVAAFGLTRIRILAADACAFDYGDYDVIYWDPFAIPRRKVMERIASTARQDSVIILREPFFTGTLLFESVVPSLAPRFAICAESATFPGRFMLKHYLLRLRPASPV